MNNGLGVNRGFAPNNTFRSGAINNGFNRGMANYGRTTTGYRGLGATGLNTRAPWSNTGIGRGNFGTGNFGRGNFSPVVRNNFTTFANRSVVNRFGANRYGWAGYNNGWRNSNLWHGGYGYRWNRGFWPFFGFGFWPGWLLFGGLGGYGGYGYGGYGYAGYGGGYYNPYYAPAYGTVYDYSQPLPAAPLEFDPNDPNATPPQVTPEQAQAQTLFDSARAAFQSGDYEVALQRVDDAIKLLQSDASMHEFRALTLFALGRYDEAASAIYPVLAAGPGWNWETMQNLYSSPDAYTPQLRALENFSKTHPEDAAADFLLAYHYLTLGHKDAAHQELATVLQLEPKDRLAKALLDGLDGKLPDVTRAPAGAPQGDAVQQQPLQPVPEPPIDGFN